MGMIIDCSPWFWRTLRWFLIWWSLN